MVLRDEKKDKRKKRKALGDKNISDKCGYSSLNKRLHRMFSKKDRIKTKKNMNNSIVFNVKPSIIIKKKIPKKKKEVCIICCEVSKKLKYINCKRGAVQNVNFGRYGECCKDKPICKGCRVKCAKRCPFCNGHSLGSLTNKFPQKKPSFVIRQERIRKKRLLKIKKLKKLKKLKQRNVISLRSMIECVYRQEPSSRWVDALLLT